MGATALSIVIPAFNEEARLEATLARIREYAAWTHVAYEVLIVDDGSTDLTSTVVRRFAPGPLALRLLSQPTNRGKGHSVRQGMLAATGELILMCDADLSAPIEEVEKLLPWIGRGYDIAIGSRDLPESRLAPPQPLPRRVAAALFRTLRRRLLLPDLRDTQCGFKLFTRRAAHDVFAQATIDGWLFDCEVLALARQRGYRIAEVGIVWSHHPHSRVRPWREACTALPTLWAIRRRLRTR